MINLLLTIAFVIFLCAINIAFAIFVIPKIIQKVHKILQGELFLSIFEFLIAGFSLALLTVFLIYSVFVLINTIIYG